MPYVNSVNLMSLHCPLRNYNLSCNLDREEKARGRQNRNAVTLVFNSFSKFALSSISTYNLVAICCCSLKELEETSDPEGTLWTSLLCYL